MISVSLILEYLYYPLKVYMKMQDYDIKTSTNVNTNISLKHLLVLVKVILEKLLKDVPEFLDIVHQQYKDAAIEDTSAFERLRDDLKFNSWIITIKSQKMLKNGIFGAQAVNLLFPPSLIEFKIENRENGLLGQIDKIEIIDGVYYPIKIKTTSPPMKGVWRSDAIHVTAYAYLMEHEFNKKVPVGFVNYMRVGSKKPVLINTS